MDDYISVLAHDLRNPLATARMSSEILLKLADKDIFARHSAIIKSSSYVMESMIQNILDFARCQLHLGIELHQKESTDALKKVLEQLVKEAVIISPERKFRPEANLDIPVTCDPVRIGQLISNIARFADAQAFPNTSVKITLDSRDGEFTASINYMGNRLEEPFLQQLFDPSRQQEESLKKGVGIGMYIASEIAKAHEGHIEVESTRKSTSLVFRMKSS